MAEVASHMDARFGLTLGPAWHAPDRSADGTNGAGSRDDSPSSRKRSREDCTKELPTSKASREKMRRDRLNDRFLELGKELDPGMAAKTDKTIILSDAVRFLTRLKSESSSLLSANQQLRDQIKELKAEKTELRDEKARLKAERERLQLQLQAISMPTAGYAVPSALPAAPATPLHVSMQAGFANPLAVKAGFPGMDASQAPMALWQWMPTVRADMASDHLLRPPVA